MTISQIDLPAASTGLVHALAGQVEEEERLIEALLQAAEQMDSAKTLNIARQLLALRTADGGDCA